ncbi:hypothetical protein [Pseudoroseicyclus sp. CXY001]|uniref:hypothetical protein n=1 Tax=Pseudoroseicyclus sp. CXY001 TaxID=3242492 RepID=UPI003570F14C
MNDEGPFLRGIGWLLTPEHGGERRVALAMATVAAVGATVALRGAMRLNDGAALGPLYGLWVALAGALGAAAGLWLVRRHYGHEGRWGLVRFLWGVVLASFLAGILGGSLALPLYGTMFGPFALVTILAGAPLLAVIWLVAFARLHRSMIDWRRERDTLMRWQPEG